MPARSEYTFTGPVRPVPTNATLPTPTQHLETTVRSWACLIGLIRAYTDHIIAQLPAIPPTVGVSIRGVSSTAVNSLSNGTHEVVV